MAKPINLQDIENLENKMGNTVLTTSNKNVSDAINELDSEISILSDKVNWKIDNWKTDNDLTTAYPNKEITIFSSTVPFGGLAPCVVVTTKLSNYTAKQEIFGKGATTPIKYRLTDSKGDGTWGAWQTIATTNKTPVSLTPNTGLIIDNNSVIINNVLYLNLMVSKEDGSSFTSASYTLIMADISIKELFKYWWTPFSCVATTKGGSPVHTGGASISKSGKGYVTGIPSTPTDITYLYISGSVTLK